MDHTRLASDNAPADPNGALDGAAAPGAASTSGSVDHFDAGPVPPDLLDKIKALGATSGAAGSPQATPMRICFDRVIPAAIDPVGAKKQALARKTYKDALAQHEVTAETLPNLSADHPVARARMAMVDLRKWPDGHVLTCMFLDGEVDWQQKVMTHARRWEDYANVKLSFLTDGHADIRISFFADTGSWSAIGTDCLNEAYFPPGQPTMNYGWLRSDTPDQEYERVVVHEFGHALGCIHEHQSPDEQLDWNVEEVYRVFSGPPNNWSKDEIDHNILQKYGAAGISATVFDQHSIMLYQFDPQLFKNHVGTPLNTVLSSLDKSMIARMYPFVGPTPGSNVAVADGTAVPAADGGAAPAHDSNMA